jgi:GNAT superfamily N-acetyltransferase
MTPVLIRNAEIYDQDCIALLQARSIAHLCAADYQQDAIDAWLKCAPDNLKDALKKGQCFVACLEEDKKIVGFGLTTSQRITHLFVDPDYTRHNIGRNLLKRLENCLMTDTSYIHSTLSAVHFYQKCGYSIDSQSTYDAKGHSIQMVILRKTMV